MDLGRTGCPQGRRRGAHCRARRIHVVHEYDRTPNRIPATERAADVRPPFLAGEPCLACDRTPPRDEPPALEAPGPSELAGKPFCRMVASPQRTIPVGRDVGDEVCRRPGHAPGDELGGEGRQRAATALLPGPDERPHGAAVEDRGAGRGKRQPAAGALAAPLDGPGGRGATARAERRRDWHDEPAAAVAERRPRLATGHAARGKEELE